MLWKETHSLMEESLAQFLHINRKCNQMKVSKQDVICNRGNYKLSQTKQGKLELPTWFKQGWISDYQNIFFISYFRGEGGWVFKPTPGVIWV